MRIAALLAVAMFAALGAPARQPGGIDARRQRTDSRRRRQLRAAPADRSAYARIAGALSLAEAPNGSIVVAETATNTVRRILPGGKVRRLGSFVDPSDVVVAATGTIYVAEHDGVRVRAITPRGKITTVAGRARPCRRPQRASASTIRR
jgi:DNA-binding beta-propeller fold protein YncE